jgi:hypothetical protein
MYQPFDLKLNDAILTIAGRLLPGGFDISEEAPNTYEQLKASLDAGKRLVVWKGGSQATIYGSAEVNYAFRAWHDYCHWKGGHDLTFEGEVAACAMQCQQLLDSCGDNERVRSWCALLEAEIIGQAEYYRRHKRFPDDQRAFVAAYLIDPEEALLWSLW